MLPPDHLPFLKAIRAAPADDLPRLVFADYLEEQNTPDSLARAEFIRASVNTDGVPIRKNPEMNFVQWKRLSNRRDELFRQWADVWYGKEFRHFYREVPDEDAGGGLTVTTRGFVSRVRCSLDLWLTHGPAVVAGHAVEAVEITDREPYGLPLFAQWYDVGRDDPFDDHGVIPHLQSEIPSPVYAFLRRGEELGGWRNYGPDDKTVAVPDLNTAALLWATQEAEAHDHR